MFKQINSKFKEKLFYFLLYDLLFFLFMFIFFVFVRLRLLAYQLKLEQFSPIINSFTAENLDTILLQQTLDQLNNVANKALMFIYIAVPIVVFLIWGFFHGSSWQLLTGKKRFDFKYLLRFAVATIPFLAIIIFISSKLFNLISELFVDYGVLFGIELWMHIILLLITFYLMVVAYSDLNFKRFLRNFKIAFKKFYLMFPIALVYMILFFVLFVILTYTYIVFFSGIYTSGLITAIILFLAFLLLFIYYRIFIFTFFNKVFDKSK